jgi:hypothetical protein
MKLSNDISAPPGAPKSAPLTEPSERLIRLVDRIGINYDRVSGAYHEAGHAVVGFWYGWTIGANGVEIDAQECCSFAGGAIAHTIEARAVVAMAGWLAELKWHRQGSANHDGELISVLEAHNWGQAFVNLNDEQLVVNALVGKSDPATVETDEFLAGIEAFRQYAYELISRPPIWRAIRKVARALLAHGKLSDTEVVNAIGKADFLEVSHGRWIKEPGSLGVLGTAPGRADG